MQDWSGGLADLRKQGCGRLVSRSAHTIPTMKDVGASPDTQVQETVASLQEGIRVTPKERKQIWAHTSADPERTWTVRGAQGLPAHVRVAKGPAKIRDGKVKLFVCTDSQDEDVVLDTHEVIAELCEPTAVDKKIQEDIRAWRLHSLVSNAQALGTEYISELVDHNMGRHTHMLWRPTHDKRSCLQQLFVYSFDGFPEDLCIQTSQSLRI